MIGLAVGLTATAAPYRQALARDGDAISRGSRYYDQGRMVFAGSSGQSESRE
jgi:hypothetical protein